MACLSYPDSKRVAVFREQDGVTQPVAQLDCSQPLTGLAFSADGSSLRALGKYGSLYEWRRDHADPLAAGHPDASRRSCGARSADDSQGIRVAYDSASGGSQPRQPPDRCV